ncbi:MAG: hypothetical protein H0X59_09785 [Chloroflexi bacterium]|nr:hypothetical protein [Chloroflexota bacterium]
MVQAQGTGGLVDQIPGWQAAARARDPEARLGTLQRTLGAPDVRQCVAAYGPLAAVGAANGQGGVARYQPKGLAELVNVSGAAADMGACPVTLIDGSGLSATELDSRVGELVAALPAETLLVVAGMPDGSAVALHPIVMTVTSSDGAPTGLGGPRSLRSSGTRQAGLIRLPDLSATILANYGLSTPDLAEGATITGSAAPDDVVAHNRNLSAAITLADRVRGGFLVTTALVFAAYFAGAIALTRFAPSRSARFWAQVALPLGGSALMALPAAAFTASLLPWWRFGADVATTNPASVGLAQPTFALLAATVVLTVMFLALGWAGPWRRHPLGPMAIIAALTMTIVGCDVIFGSPLALISVFGAQPATGSPLHGISTSALGIFGTASLLLAGCVGSVLFERRGYTRWIGVSAVFLLTFTATVIVALWGVDRGGSVAVLFSLGLLTMAAAGRRVRPTLIALGLLIAAAVAGVIVVADWLRPAAQRAGLGQFVQSVLDGNAWRLLVTRTDRTFGILLDSPASWLVVGALIVALWALVAPLSGWGQRWRPLWSQPLMHACATALLATWLLAWAFNEFGIWIPALGLIMATGAGVALSAQRHLTADDAVPGSALVGVQGGAHR